MADLPRTTDALDTDLAARRAARASAPCLRRFARRLRLELVLELAADAAVVLAATAAVLVFLDWWFRFGLPVRAVLLIADCLAGVLGVSRHPGGPAVRGVAARRAVAGDDARPLPAGTGQQIADVLQLPSCWTSRRHRPRRPWCGWPSSAQRGPGRLGLAVALEPQAHGARRRRA